MVKTYPSADWASSGPSQRDSACQAGLVGCAHHLASQPCVRQYTGKGICIRQKFNCGCFYKRNQGHALAIQGTMEEKLEGKKNTPSPTTGHPKRHTSFLRLVQKHLWKWKPLGMFVTLCNPLSLCFQYVLRLIKYKNTKKMRMEA